MLFPLPGFPNKEKKRLVYLAGTVPVQYQGINFLYALHLCLERFRLCSVFSAHAILFVYQWVLGQLFRSVSALRLGSGRLWPQRWGRVPLNRHPSRCTTSGTLLQMATRGLGGILCLQS